MIAKGELKDEFKDPKQRTLFLDDTLKDVMENCGKHAKDGSCRSDQEWLEFFSSKTPLHCCDVCCFFVEWQLQTKWNFPKIAMRIKEWSEKYPTEVQEEHVPERVIELRDSLADCWKPNPGHYDATSAASKIAFFAKPHWKVFIWDQHARRAAWFRHWLRASAGTEPPRFGDLSQLDKKEGKSNYCWHWTACAEALKEEQGPVNDFAPKIEEFRKFINRENGPMAASDIINSSFIERRFLDKLMLQEGKWVKKNL
jgi:hypothetical protein